jgi:hypothetical protein
MTNVEYIKDSKIKARAEKLIENFKIACENGKIIKAYTGVDIVTIATKFLGFKIKFANLKEPYGKATLGMIVPEAKLILCDYSIEPHGENAETKEKILNFTIAHEIGHFNLHQDYMIDCTSPVFHTKLSKKELKMIETQANIFAANILMPEKIFKEVFDMFKILSQTLKREFETDPRDLITRLSDYFKVSKEAVSYRIRNLNLIDKI